MRRSKHNLSHYRLSTFNQGQLVPVACVEVLPGDSMRHSISALLRVSPDAGLAKPLMHPVQVRAHCWFVPNRLVWDGWEDFITGVNTEDAIPTITGTPAADGLLDHLGVPTGSSQTVNELPVRAYNLIYNEFYRDQDIHDERDEDDVTLANVCWEKDYFTTARTFPQFGEDTLNIPFSAGQLPVSHDAPNDSVTLGATAAAQVGTPIRRLSTDSTHLYANGSLNTDYGLYADLSSATGGINVNDFRRTLALQRFLENRARFGSRYRDYLRYLGIRPRDGRLSEPEYLGGGKQWVSFSEVLAHAEGENTEVGSMAGHGIAALRTRKYTRFFEESGYLLCLVSVRPKLMYMQNLHRHWLRSTKDDYWQKEYEAFGPQAVLTKELYAAHANSTDVFGYVDRFREYREHPSSVAGDFRDSTSYDWHMARSFSGSPSLDATFLDCVPTDRIYLDQNAPELLGMFNHHLVARRLVSKFARF